MNFESVNSFKDSKAISGTFDTDGQSNLYHLNQVDKISTNYIQNCVPLVVPNETMQVPTITTSISQLSCLSNIRFTGIIPDVAESAAESSLKKQTITPTITNTIHTTTVTTVTTTTTASFTTLSSMATLQEEDEENLDN